MIKMDYVNGLFTDIVADYIEKGYVFYSKTMGGHQGEICKVDMTNGIDIVRIRMERDSVKGMFFSRTVEIITEVYTNENTKILFNTDTLWSNKGNITKCIRFYVVDDRKDTILTDDFNEYKNITNLRKERYNNTHKSVKKLNFDIDTVYSIVKNKKGYKTVKRSDIFSVEKNNIGYTINITNKKPLYFMF